MQLSQKKINSPSNGSDVEYEAQFEPLQESLDAKNQQNLKLYSPSSPQQNQFNYNIQSHVMQKKQLNNLPALNQSNNIAQNYQEKKVDSQKHIGNQQTKKITNFRMQNIQKDQIKNGNQDNKNHQSKTSSENKLLSDKEKTIKETIKKITKNILISKQSIVEDITKINHFHHENQRKIKDYIQQDDKVQSSKLNEIKKVLPSKWQAIGENKSTNLQSNLVQKRKQQQKKIIQNNRLNQQERKRKKAMYEQQKIARKQQQILQKNQSRAKAQENQQRILYEQKLISRKLGSADLPLSEQEIKLFQNAFIQHIKQRLNIGKSKIKNKSPQENAQKKNANILKPQKSNQKNKRLFKSEKFKQKIILNLKQKIQKQLDHTYESILADQKDFSTSDLKDRNRGHQSAPQLRLPSINKEKPQRRTFIVNNKDYESIRKVHILKISESPTQI